MKNSKKNAKLNLPLLIATAVISLLAWAFALFPLSGYLSDLLPGPVAVGIVFTLFLLVICVTVLCVSNLTLNFHADVITGDTSRKRLFLYILLAAIVCFALTAGLEALYETDINLSATSKAPDTYIFVVDDSGTMLDNDPLQKRFRAIEDFVKGKTDACRYMVYTFATNVELIQPMTDSNAQNQALEGKSFGLTAIKAALEQVIQDHDQGVWTGSDNTMVILITDGMPSDIDNYSQIDTLLSRYKKIGLSVSTVGLGDADMKLLRHISDTTGGQVVDIADVADMSNAFRTVANFDAANQTLLSDRNETSYHWIYAIIRVLAIALIGVLLSIIAGICYGNSAAFGNIIRWGVAKSLLSGLLLETGISVLDLPEYAFCVIAGLLLGLVIAQSIPAQGDAFSEVAEKKPAKRDSMGFDAW